MRMLKKRGKLTCVDVHKYTHIHTHAHTHNNTYAFCGSFPFSHFYKLWNLRRISYRDRLWVKTYKGYNIRRAHILVLKTDKNVEVLQSAKTFDKAPFLNIFEILAQAGFVEKDKDEDQNQLTPSLIRQHIKLRIYNIIICYMMNKVLWVVVRIAPIFCKNI